MNLADALRLAGRTPAAPEPEPAVEASARPAWGEVRPVQKVELPEADDRPEPVAPEEVEAEERTEAPIREPEPPQVTSGNVVRLELFLNSEQMGSLLKALMAGQHTVLTAREAAAYLRVAPATLQTLAEQGEVPGVLLEGKWRFPKDALDEWLTRSAQDRISGSNEEEEHVA
ncbi:MAG: helix-turn-helix domain-containing protein [Fimbriimonadaceae bacterium]|nr:helix-turn-helix domain-containing protein [Fimbriimonadaceae bacterium]